MNAHSEMSCQPFGGRGLAELKGMHGETIANEIGDCDSFYGDRKVNHFYFCREGR